MLMYCKGLKVSLPGVLEFKFHCEDNEGTEPIVLHEGERIIGVAPGWNGRLIVYVEQSRQAAPEGVTNDAAITPAERAVVGELQ